MKGFREVYLCNGSEADFVRSLEGRYEFSDNQVKSAVELLKGREYSVEGEGELWPSYVVSKEGEDLVVYHSHCGLERLRAKGVELDYDEVVRIGVDGIYRFDFEPDFLLAREVDVEEQVKLLVAMGKRIIFFNPCKGGFKLRNMLRKVEAPFVEVSSLTELKEDVLYISSEGYECGFYHVCAAKRIELYGGLYRKGMFFAPYLSVPLLYRNDYGDGVVNNIYYRHYLMGEVKLDGE